MTRAVVIATLAATVALVVTASSVPASGRGGAAAHLVPVAVYLVRNEHVAPVRRLLAGDAGVARATLARLLRGPTAAERREGYGSAIPAAARLRAIGLRNGVATIDLSRAFAAGGGSASMQLRVAQIVYTATQFPTIMRVAFAIDGVPVAAIGGEGLIVRPPVGRTSFELQAPPILVETPLRGDLVAAPIRLRGTAGVFEGQFVAEVRSTGGTVLYRRLVHATSGSGVRGKFATTLPVPATLRNALVVVYDRSARDGRPIDVVRVPVRVAAAG